MKKPDCDEDMKIETQYLASTIVGDPAEERTTLQTVSPGVMIEVTDTLMGFPDHQRDAVARIVKGNYKGLPGEAVEFRVRLIEGKSEGWGFGGDTIYTATTDHLGYAKAPFEFGDGFARFEFDVRWIREEGKEPSCETGSFLALSPLYLEIHYFGYSVDNAYLAGAIEVWEGAGVDGVLADLPAPDGDAEKPLLAIAGLLDHNRDFVNEKDLHFSLDDSGNVDFGLGVEPETSTTDKCNLPDDEKQRNSKSTLFWHSIILRILLYL